MQAFERQFLGTHDHRILDVGGTPANWRLIKSKPQVVLLNLGDPPQSLEDQFEYVQGDGCALPFGDKSFDIVFSNSVIEHLGTRERQEAFAREIRRTGRSYYVQTPNKWFPIEPHYLTPGIHYLPKRWQETLLRYVSVWGWITRPSRAKVRDMVEEIRLLDAKLMEELFPEAIIQRERVLGLTKSLTAVHQVAARSGPENANKGDTVESTAPSAIAG
jgi:SAM-dependent methyltransferase